jgi:hypothetical protein
MLPIGEAPAVEAASSVIAGGVHGISGGVVGASLKGGIGVSGILPRLGLGAIVGSLSRRGKSRRSFIVALIMALMSVV